MDCSTVLNVIGEISNLIAAGCALVAIVVTIKENKRLSEYSEKVENKRFQSSRYEALCIDRIVACWDEFYKNLYMEFDRLLKLEQIEDERKEIGDAMEEECNNFEIQIRFLKLFDNNLYIISADYIEKIHDIVAECVYNYNHKRRITKAQSKRCLAKTSEYGYKIIEKLHEYECNDIWKET